jgi:hypothetical protein
MPVPRRCGSSQARRSAWRIPKENVEPKEARKAAEKMQEKKAKAKV